MAGKKPKRFGRPPPARQNRYSSSHSSHHTSKTAFSLKDEARFTGEHLSNAFAPGSKLRDRTVQFVSAGMLHGTLPEKPEQEDPTSPTAAAAMANMTIRSPSPTPSSSSEEVVFKGRNFTLRAAPPVKEKEVSVKPDAQPSAPAKANEAPVKPDAQPKPSAATVDSDPASDEDAVVASGFQKRLNGKSPWEVNTTPWESRSKPGIGWLPVNQRPHNLLPENVTAAAIQDYLDNIKANENDTGDSPAVTPAFARRDIDINADNEWPSEANDDSQISEEAQNDIPGRDFAKDFADKSTSSDVLEPIEQVIGERKRRHGVQYLVVYENYTVDDARWLPESFLTAPSELRLIEEFRMTERNKAGMSDLDSDSEDDDRSSDVDDCPDFGPYDGDSQDDLDERLAQRLAKQEELGLGSDDIVIFGEQDFGNLPNQKRPTGTKSGHRSGRPAPSRGRNEFPSATLMADALDTDPYNGFDVMDYERPSLRPRKKGRKSGGPPELSDSDLNDHLQSVWEADRGKKRIKKAEREELRKQGLLGRKGKTTADLSVKYKDGFTMSQVVEEIREFMDSDLPSCSLPPMEANRRETVHRFASKLGLNSKSRGSGKDRFIVLSKTTRTIAYSEDAFDNLAQQKRFRFHTKPRAGAGGGTYKVVSYKDGEQVGASAPELGPENRGRVLLEKMGWSKGTALGALDNKGILTPITHTVKTTKAGLQ